MSFVQANGAPKEADDTKASVLGLDGAPGPAADPLVAYEQPQSKTIKQLQRLNGAIFPITYPEKMYTETLASGNVSQLAFYSDALVGAVACRLEKAPQGHARLYIMTLGVLAPYRGRGIGSALLTHALAEAAKDANIADAYLHVQVGNDDVMAFYARFGFAVGETVRNYYRRLAQCDAVILSRALR